ncbi:hypothetical protein Tco_0628857 [Tanacetum coccineum]|uniref:Uncharacterized protein n=1 Tax=Tanacetum coccineum TaxID=301880 RepID=A0ABQ4WRG6_9ASTR
MVTQVSRFSLVPQKSFTLKQNAGGVVPYRQHETGNEPSLVGVKECLWDGVTLERGLLDPIVYGEAGKTKVLLLAAYPLLLDTKGVTAVLLATSKESYLGPQVMETLKVIYPIKGTRSSSMQGPPNKFTCWRYPWEPTLGTTLVSMSAMANTTPIVTTVMKIATKEKAQKETNAAPRVNIQDFCEEHYEDILSIIMDKIRHDKRKEVHTRLDFGDNTKRSRRTRESSQNSSAGTWSARHRKPVRKAQGEGSLIRRIRKARVKDRSIIGDERILAARDTDTESGFDRIRHLLAKHD